AFDATSGKPLWNSAPPATWDGESGPTSERVSVAGPPIIDRSRVIVPTVHLRGRVEFHVDCFDLKTGEALWHTPLVTGQRELNMFGREISEFTAPPVRIEGDRVLVATQLGSVVCLDLETGATLWQSLYPQIEISKATYYAPGHMRSLWVNSPPVVVEDLVLVAPTDGDSLLALDLQSGAMRWSMEHKDFRDRRSGVRSRSDFHYLLDADAKSVVLGGRRVASFSPNMGTLSEGPPRRMAWAYPTGESISNPGLRAVSSGGQILVPTDGELVGVDRRNGRPRRSLDWSGHKGSPLVTEMGLFTVGNREVYSFLNWKENLARARRALVESPEDQSALYNLALLLQKRGQAARLARPEPRLGEARRSIVEARDLLRDALAKGPSDSKERLRALLFETLLEQGRTRRMSASPSGARESWEQALTLAEGDDETSTALLMLTSLDRGRDEVRLRQRLRRLASEFDHLPVMCRLVRPGSADEEMPSATRWEPVVTTSGAQPEGPDKITRLPLALWARMEYADSVLGEGPSGSVTSPYPDLYHIVRYYPGRDWIDRTAGEAASMRIRTAMERGFTNGLDGIEARAERRLKKALAAGDLMGLEEVQRHFPYTPQAESAGNERIRWAAETGQIGLFQVLAVPAGAPCTSGAQDRGTGRADLPVGIGQTPARERAAPNHGIGRGRTSLHAGMEPGVERPGSGSTHRTRSHLPGRNASDRDPFDPGRWPGPVGSALLGATGSHRPQWEFRPAFGDLAPVERPLQPLPHGGRFWRGRHSPLDIARGHRPPRSRGLGGLTGPRPHPHRRVPPDRGSGYRRRTLALERGRGSVHRSNPAQPRRPSLERDRRFQPQ
ncbi:MAG: PQQ-binding-like beta-propeller repeat protein, partial [Planctomycetota bacterium]|nr:PQQ-binding-like beta-propeller repeat protein [Planctomycetota bacterium]